MNIWRILEQNRSGQQTGLPSFCTSNGFVIDAALNFAAAHNLPIVMEATCNQVNQFGGYTGMKPQDFTAKISHKAQALGMGADQLILGGDHLGPNPWRHEPIDMAMPKAKEMVKQYVEAGFIKIHLDASMACGNESTPSFEQVAERAAILCKVAEQYAPNPDKLFYIIGTEVPIPGGETQSMDGLQPTHADRLDETISTHQTAFKALGLEAAFERVASIVVQPGVDFSHTEIFDYQPAKAITLTRRILDHQTLSLEAHSTDYQTTNALGQLVKDHFLFLKVGPELTYMFREAIWALAEIEQQMAFDKSSDLVAVMKQTMTANPNDWDAYYNGSEAEIEHLKIFSYSDRIRYYWDRHAVATALDVMLNNLASRQIPAGLVSQYMGISPFENSQQSAEDLIHSRIEKSVARYYKACGLLATDCG